MRREILLGSCSLGSGAVTDAALSSEDGSIAFREREVSFGAYVRSGQRDAC